MRITIAQLEALVWTTRLGGVSAAATQLNLTQSSVSLRLKQLSEAVGRPMFRRSGRQLVLTPTGRSVLDHANEIIGHVETLHDRARPGKLSGLIRFGMSEGLAVAALPRIIATCGDRHQHP